MSSQVKINGHLLSKTQIGANEYRISVFRNDKLDFQFNVSLQPSGKDDVLPTYQLAGKSQTIPEWITKNLNAISDWIKKEEEK
jgi:hypothetical protein